jgi:hypothetical protein
VLFPPSPLTSFSKTPVPQIKINLKNLPSFISSDQAIAAPEHATKKILILEQIDGRGRVLSRRILGGIGGLVVCHRVSLFFMD